MSLHIIKPGFLSLVQDYGRYGYQHIGLTHGGPMDEHAFLWTNKLLDNPFTATQLEISLGGFLAEFTESTMIAICGADLGAKLNGQAISPWQSYAVKAGDSIEFATPREGLRCYLGIKGGFEVRAQLSSCSTVTREKLGGLRHNGEKIQSEDELAYHPYPRESAKQVPQAFIPQYSNTITLRFIPNQSAVSAGQRAYKDFIRQPYKVSQHIDRMGYRLSGKALETETSAILSHGISMGAIQVPKDGQPIVLMRDRQTMGGYPLLGCVAYLDLPLLAQSPPGTQVSFSPIDIDEAEAELLRYQQFFMCD